MAVAAQRVGMSRQCRHQATKGFVVAVAVVLALGLAMWAAVPAPSAAPWAGTVVHPVHDVKWGVHNSYARAWPNFVAQHAAGARLFEIDVYWWPVTGRWIVAHAPVPVPGATGGGNTHVVDLAEAACTLGMLGGGAAMMLDVKSLGLGVGWTGCGTGSAAQALGRQLAACAGSAVPLDVFLDVSCTGLYDNVGCADALVGSSSSLPGVRVHARGRDWWWLAPRCDRVGAMRLKAGCHGDYREPAHVATDMGAVAEKTALYECGDCGGGGTVERECVRAAVRRPRAPGVLALVQVQGGTGAL